MEILIDNPLGTMYGPYFLIFFGFIIFFAVIILALVKSQFDKTDRLGVPSIPPNIDPYEIAYLRGGNNEVARSLIFSLMQKGYIEIDDASKPVYIKKTQSPPKTNSLNPIEQLTLGWLGNLREPREIFDQNGLVKQLEVYGNTYQQKLEQQQMLLGREDQAAFRPVKWTVFLIILGLGGYKLAAALIQGYYNVIFLVILTIVGLLIARSVAKLPRITKLGKTYLERLQLAFENLKVTSQKVYSFSQYNPQNQQASYAGYDPLLLSMGVFGAGVLAGTVYDNYNQTFQKSQNAAGGSSCGGGGCGSSCSSTSSCSSGDSGGSSCGGGCGGCGGGD